MAKVICKAIVEFGRINLVISKKDKDYQKVADVLNDIDKKGVMSWYGDVTDENKKETSGLIITSKPSGCSKNIGGNVVTPPCNKK